MSDKYGRIATVTGATSGIGEATVKKFVAAGLIGLRLALGLRWLLLGFLFLLAAESTESTQASLQRLCHLLRRRRRSGIAL